MANAAETKFLGRVTILSASAFFDLTYSDDPRIVPRPAARHL